MEIRTLREDEHEAWLDLLDGWGLPDGWRGRDFFRRWIELDPSYADENVWVAADGERLLSTVQVFPRRLRVLGHAVPAGGIGSVFTAEDARRRGLAGSLLDRAAVAMGQRGMELSLLFTGRIPFYTAHGWQSWPCQRTVLRLGGHDGGSSDGAPPDGIEISAFDWEKDFEAVKAIHSAYSASRNGTVVRDDGAWAASFRLAGNPAEEFRVARRDGRAVAYARATLLEGVFMITEIGRLDDASGALAALLIRMLEPRDADPLAPPGKTSRELRAFAVLPAFDDIPLTVDLEQRRVTTAPVEDPSAMLRCLNVEALARRLEISLLPGETGDEFLARILPSDSLVSWPADRF